MAKLTDAEKTKLAERLAALSPDEREAVVDVLAADILKIIGLKKENDTKPPRSIAERIFGE